MEQDNQRQAALKLSYLAGIIDGEGAIGINKSKPYAKNKNKNYMYSARICVGMVERQIIDMLHDEFGGHVREERIPNRRSIHRWAVSGVETIKPVLDALIPILIVKKEQAIAVREFVENKSAPFNRKLGLSDEEIQLREDAYLKLRKLNAVGAAATTK